MSYAASLSTQQAFQRYEAVRHRLPDAKFPDHSMRLRSLSQVAPHVDAFVLDAFGVLNVGQTPIPGAIDRIAELRGLGKRLVVLTNAASDTRAAALAKYRRLGFDFSQDEVVASRDVFAARLGQYLPMGHWGAISTLTDTFSDLPAHITRWDAANAPDVDGFLMLSSADLNSATQDALHQALRHRPRPLLVANPDIVAPRETGLTCEPGFFAHALADDTGAEPVFFGKPFANAYDDVKARLPGIPPHRIAMVGDTLHTDVLGGGAAGFRTVLIADFGLFAGHDIDGFIAQSGIRPDFICDVT